MVRNRLVKLFSKNFFAKPKRISTQYVAYNNCGARF